MSLEDLSSREQRNIVRSVDKLEADVATLSQRIGEQRTEMNENFRLLDEKLGEDVPPQVCLLGSEKGAISGLENFDGEADFDEFVSLFLRIKEANGWTDERALKILPACLRGGAARVFSELPDDKKSNLQELVKSLKNALQPEQYRRTMAGRLQSYVMKPYQTVSEFSVELEKLHRIAHKNLPVESQNQLLMEDFLHKLVPSLKKHLILQKCDNYQSLKNSALEVESYSSCLNAEDSAKSTPTVRLASATPQALAARHDASRAPPSDWERRVDELEQGLRSLANRGNLTYPYIRGAPRSNFRQYNNNRGYKNFNRQAQWSNRGNGRRFPSNFNDRNRGPPGGQITCHNCGRRGHIAIECYSGARQQQAARQPNRQHFLRSQHVPGYQQGNNPAGYSYGRQPQMYQSMAGALNEPVPNPALMTEMYGGPQFEVNTGQTAMPGNHFQQTAPAAYMLSVNISGTLADCDLAKSVVGKYVLVSTVAATHTSEIVNLEGSESTVSKKVKPMEAPERPMTPNFQIIKKKSIFLNARSEEFCLLTPPVVSEVTPIIESRNEYDYTQIKQCIDIERHRYRMRRQKYWNTCSSLLLLLYFVCVAFCYGTRVANAYGLTSVSRKIRRWLYKRPRTCTVINFYSSIQNSARLKGRDFSLLIIGSINILSESEAWTLILDTLYDKGKFSGLICLMETAFVV